MPLPNDPTLPDPQTAAPPVDPMAGPPNPLVTVPMSEDQRKKWKSDIDRADKRRKRFEPAWERNLKAYTPDPSNEAWGDEINPGVDFYQVEQKKGQLFFDTPTIILTPEEDTPPALAQPIAAQQAKLNQQLGRHHLDAKRLMDTVLFDVLCTAGMGCTKLGVTRITKDVPVPHPTDPNQPNLGQDGQPVTAPVPVYTKIFWERFSPKQFLCPTNFHSTQFDKAPWLGVKFIMPKSSAIRQFNLPPDFQAKALTPRDQVFQYPGATEDQSEDDEITGKELWYQAALYDDAVYHPDWLRQLVFVDGQDDPVVHRDSPYQTFANGDFTPDSMIGNPIHLFTIRDMSDSAYIASDCTQTRPLVNELQRFRTQLVEMRDASTPIRVADGNVITNSVLDKITRGPIGTILRIADYDPARPPVMMVAPPVYQRDNFTSQDKIEQDLSKVSALSANQVGTEQDTVRSATELTYVQRNADVRLQAERNRVTGDFLRGVAKLDALIKRYEGIPGQPALSGYAYDIKPDSGMHVDAAADRKFALDRYNFLAKDPNCNRMYLLKETAPLLHLDPNQLIVQPPPPSAPPPKTTMVIRGEDLSPLTPQYANVLQVLTHEGVQGLAPSAVTPEMIQNAARTQQAQQPPHPGTAPKGDLLSKHTADATGEPANFGGHAGSVQ